jgi:hypothetical protein
VTQCARDAVLLGINIDASRLYDGEDPHYELWLLALIEEVSDMRRKIAEEERRQMKRGR